MMSLADPTSPQAHRRRPVAQYTDDGRWVASFPSVLAAHEATGIGLGNISTAALGRRWRAGGYVWQFTTGGAAPERIDVNAERRTRKDARPVVQCSLAGERLAEFASVTAAGRAAGVHHNSVKACANRHRRYRTAGGFVWRWADDPDYMFGEYRRTRDVGTRNALVVRFLSVVHAVAHKLHAGLPSEVQYDDLVTAGTFGLMRAVDSFDPAKGVKFPAYAKLRVRGAMLDELRNLDFVPRLVRARAGPVAEAARQFAAETGRAASDDEMRERLGVDEAGYAMLTRDRILRVESLSSPVAEGAGELIDLIEDGRAPRPDAGCHGEAVRDVLLKHLSLTDALILRLYYLEGLSIPQISPSFGISETRVWQRRKQAIQRLGSLYTEDELTELIGGRAE
jgi:RNA polymerase sigma factor for flagellar operon FliA